ncbi:MAG: hypothetical protein LRY51_09240 [Geovibrio sp.]|nr:hypothetical protein [Geovibrio sp.]
MRGERAYPQRGSPLQDADFDGGLISYPYAVKGEFEKPAKAAAGEGTHYLYPSSLRLHSGSYTRWSPDLAKVYGEAKLEISPADAEALGLGDGAAVSVSAAGITKTSRFMWKTHTKGCVPCLRTMPTRL